jgi:hypothetical protein
MVCHFKGSIVCRLVPDQLDERCITSKVIADYAHYEAGIFSIKDVNDFHLHLSEKIVLYVVEPDGDATAAQSGGSRRSGTYPERGEQQERHGAACSSRCDEYLQSLR